MTDIEKLQEEELKQLNKVEFEEEVNLEELLILGEDKKIPILIEYPLKDGSTVKAKALVKQLTLKELKDIKGNENNLMKYNLSILTKSLFKTTGDHFTNGELLILPLGVLDAISDKILELSGVNADGQKLKDF